MDFHPFNNTHSYQLQDHLSHNNDDQKVVLFNVFAIVDVFSYSRQSSNFIAIYQRNIKVIKI